MDPFWYKKIKGLRKAKGLTQEQLGNEVGLGKASICAIEKGKRGTTPGKIEKIANTLGISLADLLEEGNGIAPQHAPKIESVDDIRVRIHADLIRKFKNKDLAIDLNRMLIELEEFGEENLLEIRSEIKGMLKLLRRGASGKRGKKSAGSQIQKG